MIKFLLFNFRFMLFFPIFQVLIQTYNFLLLLKYVFSHLINSNFKLCYSYSLNVVNFIIFLQLVDQSNKLFFLLFNINIISLQILVFLFAKNIIELCIKIANDSLDGSISLFKLLPTFRVCNSYFNCLFLYVLWY